MNTNTVSAFVLASFACLSVACGNTSPINEAASDELHLDAPADSHADKDSQPDAHSKPLSPADKLVVALNDSPFGATYEDWVAAYWQWAMSIPADTNPILDGACDQNQSGDVFFLAGAMGGGHHRSCTIPRGKGIFIPILSNVVRSCPEAVETVQVCQDALNEELICKTAMNNIDIANPALTLTIDGHVVHDLNQFRVQSDLFKDTSPENPADRLFPTCSGSIEANLCGMTEGQSRATVADGYFVMLHHLSDGPHQIHMAANVSPDSPEPAFEVTYNIFVSLPGPTNPAY
jgi:hypothetical protein